MSTFQQKWDDLLQNSTKRPKAQQPNSSLHIYDRNASQGEVTAINDFNSLNLDNIVERQSSNGTITRIGRDPENNVVNMHYSSKEHIWTIEYKNWKIRYPSP